MCSLIEIQSVKAHSESGWYPCRVHLLLAQQTESNSGCDPTLNIARFTEMSEISIS